MAIFGMNLEETGIVIAPLVRDELDMIALTGSERTARDLVNERNAPGLFIELRFWQASHARG